MFAGCVRRTAEHRRPTHIAPLPGSAIEKEDKVSPVESQIYPNQVDFHTCTYNCQAEPVVIATYTDDYLLSRALAFRITIYCMLKYLLEPKVHTWYIV